jgi:surface carbohydrate biosynthesis protein
LAKKPIDVLLFIEHVARELDIACAVKYLAQQRHGLRVEIASIIFDVKETREQFEPIVVATPYCFAITSLNIAGFLKVWPDANYVNLAYEQIFRHHQLSLKAPADKFARKNVVHHSWAKFNADFLTDNGVLPENIVANGNPTYSLYTEPYTAYFPTRHQLAIKHGLDEDKNWVFVPENYGAAFGSDRSVRVLGANPVDQAEGVREFARQSFHDAVIWWAKLAKEEDVEIIVRPRPATPESSFKMAMQDHVDSIPARLHIIKQGTTREWILASDSTFSSYSTSLIESSIARRPSFMLAPQKFPEYLDADWHEMIPHVETYEEFRDAACISDSGSELNELGKWAQLEMMGNGDPISNLVDLLNRAKTGEVKASVPIMEEQINAANPPIVKPNIGIRAVSKGRRVLARMYHSVGRKPPSNHEDDRISQSDIDNGVARWESVLG